MYVCTSSCVSSSSLPTFVKKKKIQFKSFFTLCFCLKMLPLKKFSSWASLMWFEENAENFQKIFTELLFVCSFFRLFVRLSFFSAFKLLVCLLFEFRLRFFVIRQWFQQMRLLLKHIFISLWRIVIDKNLENLARRDNNDSSQMILIIIIIVILSRI